VEYACEPPPGSRKRVLTGLLQLPCEHIFHGDCAENWLARNDSCPMCRNEVTEPSSCVRFCLAPKAADAHLHEGSKAPATAQLKAGEAQEMLEVDLEPGPEQVPLPVGEEEAPNIWREPTPQQEISGGTMHVPPSSESGVQDHSDEIQPCEEAETVRMTSEEWEANTIPPSGNVENAQKDTEDAGRREAPESGRQAVPAHLTFPYVPQERSSIAHPQAAPPQAAHPQARHPQAAVDADNLQSNRSHGRRSEASEKSGTTTWGTSIDSDCSDWSAYLTPAQD